MKIGILGDGQLALLMAEAFAKLKAAGVIDQSYELWILSPLGDKCPASKYGAKIYTGDCKNAADVEAFITNVGIDRLTAEMTHFDLTAIEAAVAANKTALYPDLQSFKTIQDKYMQKLYLNINDIPTAPYIGDLQEDPKLQLITQNDFPVMLKTRDPARDGAGVRKIENKAEYDAAIKALGTNVYSEKFLEKTHELSVIVVRGEKQEVVYPVTESIAKDNTCYLTETPPANISSSLTLLAQKLAIDTVKNFTGTGTFVVDLFVTADNKLYVNGVTPRLDNTCHFTVACETSAYENNMRAILGLDLKDTKLKHEHVIMANILGTASKEAGLCQFLEQVTDATKLGAHVVQYDKEAKPNRKLGHAVFMGPSCAEARTALHKFNPEAYHMLPEPAPGPQILTGKSAFASGSMIIKNENGSTGVIGSPQKPYKKTVPQIADPIQLRRNTPETPPAPEAPKPF